MQSKEYKYYGLIAGELQIKSEIILVCKVISPNTVDEAKLLMAETIAVESHNGKATDYSPNYGEGLSQFDRGTFNYIKDYYSQSKYKDLRDRIKLYLNKDITIAKYEDLRKSPRLSAIFTRLLYYKVPYAIPTTLIGRWQYYKKWFNSVQGATTESKYMRAREYAVFKDTSSNKVA